MKTLPPGRSTRTEQGFTLVEMIGVLAVIAILASLLVPRVFQAIGDSKINNSASTCNSVKSAINEYYGKFGVIGTATGASLALAADGDISEDWDLSTLVAGGFMEKPFAVKVGNGFIGSTAATPGSRLRVVNISANVAGTGIAGAAADLAQGSYDLDGSGGLTANDVIGQLVVEGVIQGVEEQDAKELNDRIDGTSLGAALGAADEKGRVKYTAADAGKVDIRIYLAHK